ncbi:hypothetical protein [Pantoea agglomerans]|uniref:hypothetical protein n=1 Tax=Enterobacter agglomerans TaxID=549 RepID=UPI00244BC94E|nr:hypothetical protein [Pantoea agglomerans]MDH1168655.1 hypothetical protein [Pantoea agglomerans]
MFDFFKDMFSAFRQNSLERIKSPFLGAFVFSWLGFNWQMLAILFLSKDDILTRLNYINLNFNVDKLLLGPISTTILICIMLPTANKIITKLQKKTNHETNIIILQSKIDIATKQLEIAAFEAKKKLAEEREKKNIEADVNAIITSRDQLADNLKDARGAIDAHQKTIDNLLSREASLKDSIKDLDLDLKRSTDDNEKLNIELEVKRKSIEDLNRELNYARSQMNKVSDESIKNSLLLNSVTDEKFKLQGEVKSLKEQNEKLRDEVKEITVEFARSKVNKSNKKASEAKIALDNDLTSSYVPSNQSGALTVAAKSPEQSAMSAAWAAATKLSSAAWSQSATQNALAAVKFPEQSAMSEAWAAATKISSVPGSQSAISAALAASTKYREQSAMSAAWAAATRFSSVPGSQPAIPAALAAAAKFRDQSAISAAWAAATKSPTNLLNIPTQITRLPHHFDTSTTDPKSVKIIDKIDEKSSGANDIKAEPLVINDSSQPSVIDDGERDKDEGHIEEANS